MYVAVLAIIVGQALALGQLILLAYAVAAWIAVASFVHFYEEPALSRRFAPGTRPTGVPYQPGGPACARGEPASVTARAHETSPRVEAGKAQLTAGVRPHDLGASPGQSLCPCLVGLAAESLWTIALGVLMWRKSNAAADLPEKASW
jgi:Phospholipid methyltransferase